MKLKDWAMEAAAKAAGNPDLLVADSTGVPHRRKGLQFKVHFLYDIRSDLVMAATATPSSTADYQATGVSCTRSRKIGRACRLGVLRKEQLRKNTGKGCVTPRKIQEAAPAGESGGAGPQSAKGSSRPLRHLYRHRGEEERFCSRLKARLRRALRYQLVESADVSVKWPSLALNVERIATGKAST
ncbi:MAG: hypothetical protein ACTSXX_13065 [Candidatus Baldrarchaeia archaeon]